MQRITKFSAIIGFLAVMTFVIGMFMYMPTLTEKGISFSPTELFAWGDSGCGSCGDTDGNDHDYVPNSTCTMSVSASSIVKGGKATITWNTTNALGVTLNGTQVGKSGSQQVAPTQTTKYTIIAIGKNGLPVKCEKTVTVTIPVPDPVCTLSAAPTTITNGQSATLTWTTTNATVAKLNGGTVALDGTKSVAPTANTTYTITATGNGKTVTCAKTITVTTVTPNPVCTLNANPTTINNGQSSTLSWTTQNAATVSIDKGIGAKTPNVAGNQSVSPTVTTTYTLTATGNGKTVTCQKIITVTTTVPGLSCDSFNASPSSFGVQGGTTNLSWNTTGATSVSIDQGVGPVAQDGNTSVGVSNSKTFTLTATNAQNSVQCQTSVSVETDHGCTSNCGGCTSNCGGGGTSRPSCKFFKASDKDIEEGDKVTLSWETRRGQEILIKDNHGEEILDSDDDDDVDEGSIVVYPKKDTTYTLKVEGKARKTDSCTVKINVDDEVRVTTVRDREPVTTITFREVPYTGFDAGPMLAGLFYVLLAAWALMASYIVVIKKGSVMGFSLATAGIVGASATKFTSAPVISRVAVTAPAFQGVSETTMKSKYSWGAPANLPVATDDDEEEEVVEEEESTDDEEDSAIQNRAFASGIILSADALAAVKRAGANAAERLTVIDAVITRAKETFAREDGWIALDRSRISTLFN